jgi:hypothetical protein
MRRTLLVLMAITYLLPSLAQAQTSSGGGTRGASAAPRGGSTGVTIRQGAPRPPSQPGAPAVPLVPTAPPSAPPIGPFASPSTLDRDVFQARPRTYAPRYSRSRGLYYGYGGGYIADPSGYASQPDSAAPALDRYMRDANDAIGYLRLDMQPESAQVYVDGLYAGTVADFSRGGRALEAGPHRVEFNADGFDSQSVELRIRANDTLAYRGTLNRRDGRAEQRASAGPPKTFYVIPRCYAGTSRPRAEQLPPGCRISDVREVPPQLSNARTTR